MIARRLALRNFRKFRSLELELPEGLIGIVGRNGMGKTTIIEAIAFALYGMKASRTSAQGVRSEGAGSGDVCSVELEFSVDGNSYRIVRELRGEAQLHRAFAYRGAKTDPIATSPSAVEKLVTGLIGLDYTTFIRSVFARQKELHALSSAQPEERRKTIRRLIGIDKIDAAITNVRKDVRDSAAEIKASRHALEQLPEALEDRKKKTAGLQKAKGAVTDARKTASREKSKRQKAKTQRDALALLNTKFVALDKTLTTVETKATNAENRLVDLKKDLADLAAKQKELNKIRPQAKQLPKVAGEKEKLDQAKGVDAERRGLLAETKKLVIDAGKESVRVKALEKTVSSGDDLTNAVKKNGDTISSARDSLKETNSKLKAVSRKQNFAAARLKDLRAKAAKLKKLGTKGECPTCLRVLGDDCASIAKLLLTEMKPLAESLATHKQEVAALEEVAEKTQEVIDGLEETRDELADEVSDLKAHQQELKSTRTMLAGLKQNHADKTKRLTELKGVNYDAAKHNAVNAKHRELKKVASKFERLDTAVKRMPKIRAEIEKNKAALRGFNTEIKAAEGKLNRLDFEPQDYKDARVAYDKTVKAFDRASGKLAAAKATEAGLSAALSALDDQIKHLEQLKKQIAKDERMIARLNELQVVFEAFRKDLMERVRPVIAEHASLLLGRLTKGRYPRIDLDEDYNILVLDGSSYHQIERFSGGEQDLANLCLRIAISQVVAERRSGSGPSLIALDEIFGSQDVERRTMVLSALSELCSSFRQIILITHVDDIHDRVPFVLRVTEDSSQTGVASWIH